MRRELWRFEYTANKLAEAAAIKMKFHEERLEWWKVKRREVMGKIRSEGIEIDEKLAATMPFGTETGERGRLNGGWGEVRKPDGTIIKQ